MRPPFPYFGGKQQLAERIVSHFPAHRSYVEPFAGSLSVLLAKPPSKVETVNDLDGEIVNFWRMLRDRSDELIRVCELTPHSRAEKELAQTGSISDDLERARRVWVQLTQGRSGTRRNTGWRYFADPAGTSVAMPGYLSGYVDRMPPAAQRLAHVSLECRPALEVIASYDHPQTLIYADPPYLGSTRGWGNNYAVEMRAEDQHRELAEALTECKSAVVLSGYPSPLYDEIYADWGRVDLSAWTGNGTDGDRTECLWINRSPADCLDFGASA